jgi:hypothetical protein
MGEARSSHSEWAGPAEWRVFDASQLCDHVMARGDIMVGPCPDGVQAIFPPGAWSNTPAESDFEHPYTNERWRLATYLEPSPIPATLSIKTISEVVDLLLEESPQFIELVKKRCRRSALNFAMLIMPDTDNHTASAETTSKWHDDLERTRQEAEEAFGREWVNDHLFPGFEPNKNLDIDKNQD